MTTLVDKPLKIFCSYSRKDEKYLNELRTWLHGLERQKLIEWWHDREIIPGQEWREAIDENLQTADIILLLISPDFMASDFAYEEEMQRAIDRHKRREASVIPIIVRRTDLEGAPFNHLQSLPRDLKPVATWSDRDDAWLDVLRGVRKAVRELRGVSSEEAVKEERREASRPVAGDRRSEVSPLQVRHEVAEYAEQLTAKAVINASNADQVQLLHTFEGHMGGVSSVTFSRDAQLLASGSGDHTMRLWRVEDGVLLRTKGHPREVLSVVFSPDGLLLASGGNDKTVRLWWVEDGSLVREMKHRVVGLFPGVNSVAFSPDGRLLASGGQGSHRRLWRVEDGTPVHTFKVGQEHINPVSDITVNSVAFSPDGRLLASGEDENKRVRLWQVEDGVLVREMKYGGPFIGLKAGMQAVAFSPDGRLLASGSGDGKARLWQVEDGALVREMKHGGSFFTGVNSVAFSPDGQLLASGTDDTVHLWRVEDGTHMGTLGVGAASVTFSLDSRLLASGSSDHTVQLWGIA